MKKLSQIKKYFLTLPLLVACLIAPTACRKTPDEPTPPVTPDDGAVTEFPGFAGYTVKRSDYSATDVTKATANLYRVLSERYATMEIDTDWEDKDNPDNESPEILVGKTNRAASEEARTYAESQAKDGESWYYIGIHGNKIVLLGSDDANTVAAVNYYLSAYAKNATESAVYVPQKMLRCYRANVPTVVKTTVGKPGTFVTCADLGSAPYFVDASGENDVTSTLKAAIKAVESLGGGVVYLPAGQYLISDTLEIPSYVSLVGEYVDPDGGDCGTGTVLVLDAKGSFKNKSAILLHSSSAIQGLTFYYPGQSVSKPVEYHATIECVNGNGVWTVKDCTLINSYYGIYCGTSPKGMITLDNVKGTAIYRGFDSEQSADICVASDVYFSPKYWANTGKAFKAPAEADIRALMKEKKSIGFSFGDCDRDTYENILLDGFYTGIYNREMTRAGLSGSYYNLTISDAVIGMDLHGLDTRYGLMLTKSTISASDTAIRSLTDGENATTPGKYPYVNLCHCTVKGKTEGLVREIEGGDAKDCTFTRRDTVITYANDTLYNLADYGISTNGDKDISGALQKALDDAKGNGGGIVYIPAGVYLLEKPVSVGENTVILGCQQNPQTSSATFHGTVLLVTYGKGGSKDDTAAITLTGKNSGVLGMVVYYRDNGVQWDDKGEKSVSPSEYAYFLRCKGKNDFIAHVCFVGASRAVHFDGSDNFIADRILMTVFDNGFLVTNCNGGILTRIHTNGTYQCIGAGALRYLANNWIHTGADVHDILDNHIVPRLTLFCVEDSTQIQLAHCFHYGANCYLDAVASDISILNGESARLTNPSFCLHGKVDLFVINFMRPNRAVYIDKTSDDSVTLFHMNPAGMESPFNIFR